MGKNPVQTPTMLIQNDFEIPSSAKKYPIGLQIPVVDESSDTTRHYVSVYEYALAGTTLGQYGAYALGSSGSGIVATNTTNSVTSVGVARIIVPQTAVTNGYYFFGCVKGVCTVAATSAAGQNMIAGTMWKVANNVTSLSVHTAAQAAATAPSVIRQVKTVGFSTGLAATSGSNNVNVYLYGDPILSSNAAKEPI